MFEISLATETEIFFSDTITLSLPREERPLLPRQSLLKHLQQLTTKNCVNGSEQRSQVLLDGSLILFLQSDSVWND